MNSGLHAEKMCFDREVLNIVAIDATEVID